jgi:protein O-mannosyl-transferase
MSGAWRRVWVDHPGATGTTLVVLAALVASLSSLANGFALDDVLVIETRARLHTLSEPLGLLTTAYWQLPPQDTLWRPLGLLSFAVQWVVGGGAPLAFHASSIALYVACALAVLALARALLPPMGALAAGLVFAVHPVHVESVGNIVGQLELWVALAIVIASLLYLRGRRAGTLSAVTMAAIVACYALGLGMKEHAVLLPAFLIALELTVLRDSPPMSGEARTRRRALFGMLVTLAILWLVLRSDIVGGLAGDRPHVALKGLDATARAWVMLGLLPEIVRLMLWPARLYADYSPQYAAIHVTPQAAHLPGLLLLTTFTVALGWTWRRDRAVALGLLWVPLAMTLVANLVVPTGILLAERTLFLATVGVALAAGGLVSHGQTLLATKLPKMRNFAFAAGLSLIALGAAHSAERQHVWKDSTSLTTSLVIDAPLNFRGHYWLGDDLLRQGRLVEGEQVMRRAMLLWPEHDGPPLGLALRYQERGMCEPALPLYATVLRLEPQKPTPHFGYAGCLLALGRLREARIAAFAGLETGRSAVAFRFLILQADSALAATDSVMSNNWWVRRRGRPLVP